MLKQAQFQTLLKFAAVLVIFRYLMREFRAEGLKFVLALGSLWSTVQVAMDCDGMQVTIHPENLVLPGNRKIVMNNCKSGGSHVGIVFDVMLYFVRGCQHVATIASFLLSVVVNEERIRPSR